MFSKGPGAKVGRHNLRLKWTFPHPDYCGRVLVCHSAAIPLQASSVLLPASMAFAVFAAVDVPSPAEEEPELAEVQAPVMASLSSLEVAKGEELAMARWNRLTNAVCEPGRSTGTRWVGSCQEAVQWAGQHVAYIVNAAHHVYFKWIPWSLRFWANIKYKGILLTALMMGEDVLAHCKQRKHRSSALCMFIMLIIGRAYANPGSSWFHSDG